MDGISGRVKRRLKHFTLRNWQSNILRRGCLGFVFEIYFFLVRSSSQTFFLTKDEPNNLLSSQHVTLQSISHAQWTYCWGNIRGQIISGYWEEQGYSNCFKNKPPFSPNLRISNGWLLRNKDLVGLIQHI